jgi:predicted HTH transcriptional regulator
MMDIEDVSSIPLLRESVEIECKLAQGRDGRGELPQDFWPTYSAFANTRGGVLLLGVRERAGRFEVAGIQDSRKVRTELFDGANNPQKVSENLLSDSSVVERVWEGVSVLIVHIPRARRAQRPVFLNRRPFEQTYAGLTMATVSYRRNRCAECSRRGSRILVIDESWLASLSGSES